MEPRAEIFDKIMFPTALFVTPSLPSQAPTPEPWSNSQLNPKNRICSLDPFQYQNITWRIDGAQTEGTRYFAIPTFMIGKPPKMIDIYIPDQNMIPRSLTEILELDSTMLVSSSQVYRLGISQHILRALSHWSSRYRQDFEEVYLSMPYGTRIIINNVHVDVKAMDIQFLPLYTVERQWLSVGSLQSLWNFHPEQWPKVLDIGELRYKYRLHDAIALINIPTISAETTYVFKSLTQELRYMYHELKVLLSMKPHPNIVSRPLFIVTQKCRFGGKVGVCGFVLEYYVGGNLGDALRQKNHPLNNLDQRLRAAKQIASALLHIQDYDAGFYPDLKLPNILISSVEGQVRALIVDFENRGGWFSWSPPEIYYFDYLEYLADFGPTSQKPKYIDKLQEFMPTWIPRPTNALYTNPRDGYSTSWNCLSVEDRESAVVFMFGKLLWCLLEGVGVMDGMMINPESFRDERSPLVFPEFRNTPPRMRECIRWCTAGAPEWVYQSCVVLRESRLFPRGGTGQDGEPVGTETETQVAATAWWEQEIEQAEIFLRARKRVLLGEESVENVALLKAIRRRPKLADILRTLDEICSEQ